MKVLLRAPLLTMSGYGVHSRQVFEWLHSKKNIELDVECLNWGMTPWIINQNYENGLIQKIMSCSRKTNPPYDVTFQLQLPDEWDSNLGKFNVGMSAFVETDLCNPKWIESANKMDHIVVPSNFTKDVVKKSGMLTTKISVIPEWFNDQIESASSIDYKFDTSFNFLIISQLNSQNPPDDRKNIFNTIKWLCETFKDNNDVGIVLKTNSGKGTTIDKKITQNIMEQMIRAIGKKSFPKIYLFHGNMSKKEMAGFYKSKDIKVLASATRGEGYGLPLIDAASSGMPVIATNWSGHLDFLGKDFIKVDYDIKEIRKEKADNRIFFEGFKWAEPKENDFKKKAIEVYKNYKDYKLQAKELKSKIHFNFSKKAIINQYDIAFKHILG